MGQPSLFDAVVVGAGPAGLVTALALAHEGVSTALAGPPTNAGDARTAALFEGSIELFKTIGVWKHLAPLAEPIRAIRLIDDTGGLVRAPEVLFEAKEIGREAFGFNIPTGALGAELERIAPSSIMRITTTGVSALELDEQTATLTTGEGETLTARLVAAADGRSSRCREAARIGIKDWTYPQAAVVATITHSRPHRGISTELHRLSGPLTIVPMPGDVSSLVWVEQPDEAARLAGLCDSDFLAELKKHFGYLLGTLGNISPRRVFPLSGQSADVLGKSRVALIGEAGHVIPPIGAQGLNLSLRDAATLAELAGEATQRREDPGAPTVLFEYERRRRPDIASRVWSIDIMNRSLISDLPPVNFARGLGLAALKAFSPLRRFVMGEGMTPSFATPRLMRPQSTSV